MRPRLPTTAMSGMSGMSGVAGSVDAYAAIKAATLAFYRLEADGTDSSGNGRTITMTGTPTFASGKVNNAATFDGASNLGSRAAILTSGSFWINFWVKFTGTNFGGFVSQCTDTGVTTGTFVIDSTFGSGDRPRMVVRNLSTFTNATWGSAINDGNWHMIDGWYDGTNINIDVDNSGTPVQQALTGPAAFDSNTFQLANAYTAGLFTYARACSLDNILVANIAPTSTQRSLMWNGGAGYQLF